MSDVLPVWSDSRSRHHVWLQWHQPDAYSEGGVSISGQLLGDGEYEYAFTVAPADLPALWAAFGVPFGDDREALAVAVRERYAEVREAGDRAWLEAHGVPFDFWNRVEHD